ncbi:hypothetical protein [Acaryochloris sp. CCMEE 5410]|nr:hypothetical protein [Acaryochloris sp. CCMEE 5410]
MRKKPWNAYSAVVFVEEPTTIYGQVNKNHKNIFKTLAEYNF